MHPKGKKNNAVFLLVIWIKKTAGLTAEWPGTVASQ